MLDYIKQQIAERQKAAQPQTMTEADENDLIVEYAHLFQELDDLSVEGQDAYRDRSLELDIPIENDIELDTIEMNLMDGRITDIPMDAIVNQENFVESMKTYADFYLEACSVVQPFMREDAYNLEERRQSWAKKHYDVYHEQMVQEGLYGFDRMSMDDDHVPTNVMCDFGLLGSDDVQRYMVKSPVFFESADGEIVASQLTALAVAKNEHIFEQFADVLANKLNVNRNDVWDVATPTRVIVPVPKDEYHIIVEFDCENKNVPQYCGWKMSRKPSVRNNPIPENMYPSEASSQIVAAIPLMNKKDYVKESYVAPVVKMPSRWDQYEDVYQEAIDFGYPDANTEAANKNQPADSPQGQQQQQTNDNNPPELNEGGNDPSSPTIDAGGNDTPPEDNTPGEPATDTPPTDTPPADEPKSPVETNDVSDQIAENISNQTTDNGADANGDISIDDDLGSDVGDDMNMDTPNASTPDSIDSDLNSLDSMGGSNTDDVPMGDPSTMDIDSMSIDDIMAQAAEKLKGMPIEQVKKFLSDGAGGLDDTSSTGLDDTGMQTESYYAQEAFLGIITKKNVKPELDEAIRGCLGVLNDSNKSLSEIIVGFKKAGKKLNKVLGKAIKMTDVFGTDQLTHLNKLNSALVKLQTGLKPTVSTDETNAVKAMIKNFTSEAVIVGKFLESSGQVTPQSTQKPNKTADETVQESVFGKKVKEYLIWWLTGGVLRRGDNKPYNQLEFDTWTFLLQAVGGLLSFGFLNLYTDIRTFIRTHDMLNDNIDEIVATELTTDITKAVGFLAQDNSNTEIVGKLSKFKKALKDIIADAKYANKCKGALKDNVIKLSESASKLLNAVESFEKEKKNNGNASVNATLINDFMNACDAVINTCFDKNKLNAAIKDIKNKKDGE